MYKRRYVQKEFEDFYLPFGGKLKSSNRWVILSKLIPWNEFEENYSKKFKSRNRRGAPSMSVRIALGSLIIQKKLGLSDVETVQQISENPYLQYFLGYHEYMDKLPFDSSMMVHFRKRLGKEIATEINERITKVPKQKPEEKSSDDKDDNDKGEPQNKGILKVDASCTPADIKYPTDLNLLNEGREKLEKIIDRFYEDLKGKIKKPRTYRKVARSLYLSEAKKKSHTKKGLRKAVGRQLGFIRRDLKTIDKLLNLTALDKLNTRQYKELLVISELFRQQKKMHKNRTHNIDYRIVNISQPHIRPIVRGKAKSKTEFGAKISISVVNGFTYLDHLSFDSYNEGTLLKEHIEKYHERFGCYPEAVQCDKIYRNRDNIEFCKSKNIRISGPSLGRKKKNNTDKALIKKDAIERIEVERKFGLAKRRYNMNLIMTKLPETTLASVALTILVMNLDRILRILFLLYYSFVLGIIFYMILNRKMVLNFYFRKSVPCYNL